MCVLAVEPDAEEAVGDVVLSVKLVIEDYGAWDLAVCEVASEAGDAPCLGVVDCVDDIDEGDGELGECGVPDVDCVVVEFAEHDVVRGEAVGYIEDGVDIDCC